LKACSVDGAGGEAYAASKHGVVGLMRHFAVHLGKHGIRVNTLHPAGVDTLMVSNEAMRRHLTHDLEDARSISNVLPVCLIECADITHGMLYLVSEAGRYVTGVTLSIDGGFNVRL
jgi:NAD(P)-dependent dehydrogenase (short-subunit alcohol dehydrogenase family)